jgi:hypothetical protein
MHTRRLSEIGKPQTSHLFRLAIKLLDSSGAPDIAPLVFVVVRSKDSGLGVSDATGDGSAGKIDVAE